MSQFAVGKNIYFSETLKITNANVFLLIAIFNECGNNRQYGLIHGQKFLNTFYY